MDRSVRTIKNPGVGENCPLLIPRTRFKVEKT